jgi:type VI secretion system protein ImpA
MINVEDLLKPISDDKPSGEDFTYHPSFQNLETISRGKPETQFSPAEEPQWKEVRDAAIEVLGQSKHLTAGVVLTVALLKIGGLEGFRDGLGVVRGLTENFWEDLYPRLNPEDNNDPTERLNILNSLSSAANPYKVALHLRQIVLCNSPALGRITVHQIITAKEKSGKNAPDAGAPGGNSEPDLNQIQAAFRDAGPDAAKATLGLVEETISHAKGIESFLDSTLGVGRGVNFDSLNKLLSEMNQAVQPYAASNGSVEEASPGEAVATADGGNNRRGVKSGPTVSGTIQTRADVTKALNLICDYYRSNEPSSPVPFILQRAQRLVDKDFMEIVTDLTPDALSQLQIITGAKPKE